MTDDTRLADPVAAAQALPRGSMVIVRSQDRLKRRSLALKLRDVARKRGLFLLVAGDFALARTISADGVHLPEARIGEATTIRARSTMIITASTHGMRAASKAGFLDALILSAVFPTQSHPGGKYLSPARAALMARQLPCPTYALGGISAENVRRLAGFTGIAAIGALKA
jgi:thiamine-phosphate pyrophosphorylase